MEPILKRLEIMKKDHEETYALLSPIIMILIFMMFGAAVLYVLINSAA